MLISRQINDATRSRYQILHNRVSAAGLDRVRQQTTYTVLICQKRYIVVCPGETSASPNFNLLVIAGGNRWACDEPRSVQAMLCASHLMLARHPICRSGYTIGANLLSITNQTQQAVYRRMSKFNWFRNMTCRRTPTILMTSSTGFYSILPVSR